VSMLVWSQTAPSGTDSAACRITARTAAVSCAACGASHRDTTATRASDPQVA
jgi:hypothetical protein